MSSHFVHRFAPVLLALCSAAAAGASQSSVLSEGWRFHRGAAPGPAQAVEFDDSGWRELRLPHDWGIEGPFQPDGDGATGRLPWKGEGWYRRWFDLPEPGAGRRVYLDFDGVMAFPEVYINGQLAGQWDYGYTSFRIDATPWVRWGSRNLVAVHADTRRWGSRWYPGAGIYRKVTLVISEAVHIAHWGVQARTNGDERSGSRPDTANLRTTVENHSAMAVTVRVEQSLEDPAGNTVAQHAASLPVPAGGSAVDEQSLQVAEPRLWDVDDPALYTLTTTVRQGDKTLDSQRSRFGFRTFAFTAEDGFHLNGRRVQLHGVANHHDLGPLGGAFNRRAAQRQLEILKEMGVNALRTAHNPPAPEVLDLCDEMGIVVWDEVFDKYAWTAGRPDLQPPLAEFSRRHIDSMVRRDFNHPSVVVWSTGNEVWPDEEHQGINPERVKMMADFVRDLDRTRPVGMACHIPGLVNGRNFAALDLAGWNYGRRYARYHEQYPDRPVVYSESASALSTRGFYAPDFPGRTIDYSGAYQVSSYDLNAAPWSDVPDAEFRLMEQDQFVAGEFVWTGFDYLGEPTPFTGQARSSYFGIVDLAGFPKDRYWLYRSHWRPEVPTVHILPHWNWPNRVGLNVPVFVYTNGDSAELFLNGRSLGVRHKGEVPGRPPNLALGGKARAGSAAAGHPAEAAADGEMATEWRAGNAADGAWWQIDLGEPRKVSQIRVDTLQKESLYAYVIEASVHGQQWRPVVDHPTRRFPLYSGPTRIVHTMKPFKARYLRLRFEHSDKDAPYGLKEFAVFGEAAENDYYDVTYAYRLRWNHVTYEPGQLRAVAYRDGAEIGQALVETTGAPERLRLTADRREAAADGEGLVFVTVEALDAEGRPNPLAGNLVRFELDGPGDIAAVGNGNPLSFEPFESDRRHLFYGKALLIVRPRTGEGGTVRVRATSPGLEGASVEIDTKP